MSVYLKSFLTYSFLGWTAENVKNWNDHDFISCNPIYKQFFSKDICWLPFPMAYGLGGLALAALWKFFPHLNPLAVALFSAILFNLIELVIGYTSSKTICQKFKTCDHGDKIWNYTETPNLGGYIDLEHTVYWIILGLIGYYTYPYIIKVDSCLLIGLFAVVWAIVSGYKLKTAAKFE